MPDSLSVFIVSGSHRPDSQSGKVARYSQAWLKAQPGLGAVTLLDLGKNPLPFWNEGVWSGAEEWQTAWEPHAKQIRSADALVVVSPEWHGMAPPALKNFFLLCSNAELANKPGLLIGVSAGASGTYPIAELRSSSYKNNHLCYIPDHVIIRRVEGVLNSPPDAQPEQANGFKDDVLTRDRLHYSLKMLLEYGKALRLVRASGVPRLKDFATGM